MDEKQLMSLRLKIGMIFQHFNLLKSKNVYDNIALPLKYLKYPKDKISERVTKLLETVGLTDKIRSYPSQLSGGQKQRVAIARALAVNPSILLCDEATSALDPQTTESILDLLSRLNKELNLTIILITHQMNVIQRICNKVAVIDDGKIVEQDTERALHIADRCFVMQHGRIALAAKAGEATMEEIKTAYFGV